MSCRSMKTYHMYNADSISAQSKLKEAEKQEEKQIGKSVKQEDRQAPRSPDSHPTSALRGEACPEELSEKDRER